MVNVVAAAAFLYLASWTWLEPNLRGEDVARGGDAAVWALTAFPILLLSAFANVIWLLLAARECRRHNEAWPLSTISVVMTVWISALAVNWLRSNGF